MTAVGRTRRVRAAVGMALCLTMLATGCGGGSGDDGTVELRFTWWGNAERAELTQQVIDLFEERHPNITISPDFAEFEAYWQARSTEVAGGGLPDVLQMDYVYLRQYAERGVLLDLNPQVEAGNLDTSDMVSGLAETGVIDGGLYGVAWAGNTWSMAYNPALFEQAGVPLPEVGWTWDDYHNAIRTITERTGVHGAPDYIGRIYVLELQLLQEGGQLYTEDGQLGFTRDQLRDFWNSTASLRDGGYTLPPQESAEVAPLTPLGADLVASEMSWDNFLVRYAGETETPLALGPVPSDNPEVLGQYLKPSMLLSASARTEHPEEVAMFIDFLINDPEAGRILGGNRGIPATNAQREAAELTEVEQAVVDYENSLIEAGDLQPAPPAPPAGAGTIEALFLRLGEEISYGRISVDEAVEQFFTEAETALAS